MSATLSSIPTDDPSVHAYDVSGAVSEDDLGLMAREMRPASDGGDELGLLLVLANHPGETLCAFADAEAVRARVDALSGVTRYAVVGAPEYGEALLAGLNLVVPVEARLFGRNEVDAAWEHVGARPVGAGA